MNGNSCHYSTYYVCENYNAILIFINVRRALGTLIFIAILMKIDPNKFEIVTFRA